MKKAATYSVEAFLGCQYGVPGFWFLIPGSVISGVLGKRRPNHLWVDLCDKSGTLRS